MLKIRIIEWKISFKDCKLKNNTEVYMYLGNFISFQCEMFVCWHLFIRMQKHSCYRGLLLLLLLSRFSRVRLCATPQTAAHQAPPSLGFSRQEHWSGLPFPSPMHESEKGKWSRSVVSDSSWPHRLQPTRLLRPWDFPGRSIGVRGRETHSSTSFKHPQKFYFSMKSTSW